MYLTLTGTSINILLLSQLLIHTEGVVGVVGVVGFAGGGFGGGFGASKSKTSKKQRKNRKKGGLTSAEFIDKSPATKRDVIGEEPKLDRFGLPILTAENFFPKLPPQTELECASKDEETNMESIRKAMANYIPLDFDLFDNAGAEKESACEQPWKLKLLHKSPPVLAIENFFTDAECQEYIELTKTPEKSLDDKRSDDGDNACNDESSALKIESATFSTLAHSKRTSTTWYCHYRQVPTLLAKARRLLNGLALEQMEEPQVVRYRTGEEFSWHYDEIPREQLTNGGQRIATLLVYLNTLSDTGGGGTIFRDLTSLDGIGELTMRPKKGSALLFFPACADGTPDDRTLHKGEVAVEEKTIAQMWIHERAYNAIVPEGNSHEAAIDVVKEKEVELGYK